MIILNCFAIGKDTSVKYVPWKLFIINKYVRSICSKIYCICYFLSICPTRFLLVNSRLNKDRLSPFNDIVLLNGFE